jgi:hypothetical protein
MLVLDVPIQILGPAIAVDDDDVYSLFLDWMYRSLAREMYDKRSERIAFRSPKRSPSSK